MGDGERLLSLFVKGRMIRQDIIDKMEKAVAERGCFIVDAVVGKDNDIILTVEKDIGSVSLEDCEAINDAFLSIFDRDVEDYSLTVSSAGLDQPFKVLRQFLKAIGTQVEVCLRNGRKLTGIITSADESEIVLRYSVREAVAGKKRKEMVEHEDHFSMREINSVTPHIVFRKK